MYIIYVPGAHRGCQKRVTTGIMDCCELPCGYSKSNPGTLQEQSVLTSEPSPGPFFFALVLFF